MDEGLKEIVIDLLSYSREVNDLEKEEFVQSSIVNRDAQSIIDVLRGYKPEEHGGNTALAGFYYQFLVTIDYLAELVEGKWDFVAMEFHDDIIVGNKDEVRFVQVKSSAANQMRVTEISDLYTRKCKIYNFKDLKRGNSWVDKLFYKARFFPKDSQIITQFQLVTNYIVTDGIQPTFSVKHYCSNQLFSSMVPEDDKLLSKLSSVFFDDADKENSYEETCGETLQALLSRFHISERYEANDYLVFVANHLMNAMKSPIVITKTQIDMLIGKLCANCVTSDSTTLFITRDSVQIILAEIKVEMERVAEQYTGLYGSIALVSKALATLTSEYKGIRNDPVREFLYEELDMLSQELLAWISDRNTSVTHVINRYISGQILSVNTCCFSQGYIENLVVELLKVFVTIRILHDRSIISDNYLTILVKELTKGSKYDMFVFRLLPEDEYADGIIKLKTLIKKASVKEQVRLVEQNNMVFLYGESDDESFFEQNSLLFVGEDDLPEYIKKYGRDSISKVPVKLTLIPGIHLMNGFKKIYRYPTVESFLESLKVIWLTYVYKEEVG